MIKTRLNTKLYFNISTWFSLLNIELDFHISTTLNWLKPKTITNSWFRPEIEKDRANVYLHWEKEIHMSVKASELKSGENRRKWVWRWNENRGEERSWAEDTRRKSRGPSERNYRTEWASGRWVRSRRPSEGHASIEQQWENEWILTQVRVFCLMGETNLLLYVYIIFGRNPISIISFNLFIFILFYQ